MEVFGTFFWSITLYLPEFRIHLTRRLLVNKMACGYCLIKKKRRLPHREDECKIKKVDLVSNCLFIYSFYLRILFLFIFFFAFRLNYFSIFSN